MRGNESETCYSTLLTSYRRCSFLWTLRLGPRRYSLVLSVSRSALLVVTRRHLLRSTLPVSLYIYYFPRRYSRSLGDTRFVSLRVARSSSVTCFSLRSLWVSSFFFSCLRIHMTNNCLTWRYSLHLSIRATSPASFGCARLGLLVWLRIYQEFFVRRMHTWYLVLN